MNGIKETQQKLENLEKDLQNSFNSSNIENQEDLKEDVKDVSKPAGEKPHASKLFRSATELVRERTNQLKRVPLRQQRPIGISDDPLFYRRLVNDKDDRIEKFKLAGYRPVYKSILDGKKRSKDPSQMGKIASRSVGGGMTAVYMELPIELYLEDQREKQQELDRKLSNMAINSLALADKKYSNASHFRGKISSNEQLVTEVQNEIDNK